MYNKPRNAIKPKFTTTLNESLDFSVSSKTICSKLLRQQSNARPRIAISSLSRSDRLQKSLEEIRAKKSEVRLVRGFFFSRVRHNIIATQNYLKVEKKFRSAAICIQKWVRGFLTRRMYSPILLENSKRALNLNLSTLRNKVSSIIGDVEHLSRFVIIIQKWIRGFLCRKRYKVIEKIKCILKEKLITHSGNVILRAYRKYRLKKQKIAVQILNEKLRNIRERLKMIKIKCLWENRKFNWKVIKIHYSKPQEEIKQIIIIEEPDTKAVNSLETKDARKKWNFSTKTPPYQVQILTPSSFKSEKSSSFLAESPAFSNSRSRRKSFNSLKSTNTSQRLTPKSLMIKTQVYPNSHLGLRSNPRYLQAPQGFHTLSPAADKKTSAKPPNPSFTLSKTHSNVNSSSVSSTLCRKKGSFLSNPLSKPTKSLKKKIHANN